MCEWFSWPPAMIATFVSAMNLLKEKRKEGKEPEITRRDVYNHIFKRKDIREKFQKVLGVKIPWEKAIYEYMDRFVKEGFFIVTKEVVIGGKKYQKLTGTPKAERVYESMWAAVNLSKEAIEDIVTEVFQSDTEVGDEKKEELIKRIINKLEERRLVGFPFSISNEMLKKLLKEGKGE